MDSGVTGIKILRGCGASGKSLTAGTVYAVPAEVSNADAMILIRLGKAEPAESRKKPKKIKPAVELSEEDNVTDAVD